MANIENFTEIELTKVLSYAGFILIAFELIKSLIVKPIKLFYNKTIFDEKSPFKSYDEDVLIRHKHQFEACLLYLRDFMKAINSADVSTIQTLRKHRNDLAHNLPKLLPDLDIKHFQPLLDETDKILFKLSNYQIYMEIGTDPKFQNRGIDWSTMYGPEYALFKKVLNKLKILQNNE